MITLLIPGLMSKSANFERGLGETFFRRKKFPPRYTKKLISIGEGEDT